jgi:hypothetical protein
MDPKNLARAVRYRQLALAEPDKAKAAILREIADEAERWPAPGSEDTRLRCLMEQEAGHGETAVYARVQG